MITHGFKVYLSDSEDGKTEPVTRSDFIRALIDAGFDVEDGEVLIISRIGAL